MSFIVDKQTLDDLNIFSRKNRESIYTLFNRTNTKGGAEVLEQMFRYPLSVAAEISARTYTIGFFNTHDISFPVSSACIDAVETYLSDKDERSRLSGSDNLARKLNNVVGADTAYKAVSSGITAVLHLLQDCHKSITTWVQAVGYGRVSEIHEMAALLADDGWVALLTAPVVAKRSYEENVALDQLLRFRKSDQLHRLLYLLYRIDVYISVKQVAFQLGFVFPEVLENTATTLRLEGVYHPLLKNAKGNNLVAGSDSNIIFLTGANMAGKSTLMKSLGICVYLAHVGFPVPAAAMSFTVMDGLFTTINLADNLNMGYSHFYAEVMRVKRVAEQIHKGKNLLVIFDELFRGTNVKDAWEATVAITTGFAKRRNCLFVVSTHIIEAGEALRPYDNIRFVYLPTRMKGTVPEYTYQLEEGITADRHGMIIIHNEGIIETLKKVKA
ncbi:MutS domain III [Chitinophaga costaii]|uniref:MutS domain III n=1 Tax=Chitinophaga costaii TaxID=1335309 RepID=A0A1C4E170_9BACT|nr:DNA mismatch repair protein [Chitinophaga costaii]PUZ24376.1 DNA mismatch repair protein [Chitinophaga costaii]SCC37387.1 MutS domain III [Chitinophaga costaii]